MEIENKSMGQLHEQIRNYLGLPYIGMALFTDLPDGGRSIINATTQEKIPGIGVWEEIRKEGRKMVEYYIFRDERGEA